MMTTSESIVSWHLTVSRLLFSGYQDQGQEFHGPLHTFFFQIFGLSKILQWLNLTKSELVWGGTNFAYQVKARTLRFYNIYFCCNCFNFDWIVFVCEQFLNRSEIKLQVSVVVSISVLLRTKGTLNNSTERIRWVLF